MTRERKWRIALGIIALFITAYYVVGEMLINLYAQVTVFHICWIAALATLWHRAMRPSFSLLPNVATMVAAVASISLAQVQLNHACETTYREAEQLCFQRLGIAPEEFETPRDPWRDARWNRFSKDPEMLATLRKAMINRNPGWCRATVILADLEEQEVPRVCNWTAAEKVWLCGTGAFRDPLPFPRLSFAKARLRIENELIASAEPLRQKMIQKLQ